jgi:hypothetical protein
LPAKRRIGIVALIFFLGVILGSVVGELIGIFAAEDSLLQKLFATGPKFELEPRTIDMVVFTVTIGFSLKVNLVTILGIILVAFLLRVYC